MLYGKRPFGEGKSQDLILKEGTILSANQVEFPGEKSTSAPSSALGPSNSAFSGVVPKVSEEAKEFIRACLAHDQNHRPDVHTLSQHPYLAPAKRK